MRRIFKWLIFTLLGLLLLLPGILGVAYVYKAEILAEVNLELSKHFNGDFHLGDVSFSFWDEFPNFSITLHEMYIRGPKYLQYRTDFLRAKKVHVNVRLVPLLFKTVEVSSVRVTEGEIFIFRARSGYTNLDVLKTNKTSDTTRAENPVEILVNKIELEGVRVSFQDSLKKKSIALNFLDLQCRVMQTDSSNTYTLTGPMEFGGLMLNPRKGSYLKNKAANVQLNLEFSPNTKHLNVRPSVLEFAHSKVSLEGDFYFAGPGRFVLKIGSDKLQYSEGISLLTEAIQSKLVKYTIEKPVRVTTVIDGTLAPNAEPKIDVTFQLSKSAVKAFSLGAEGVTVDGTFSNHADGNKPNNDHNSVVRLTHFEGIFQGLPTRLTASVLDLIDPFLQLESTVDVDLRDLKALIDPDVLKFGGGKFSSHVEYAGKLNQFLDTTRTHYDGKLLGSATVTGGSFLLQQRKQFYEKINVSLDFNQDHVAINSVSFVLNKSPVTIQGEIVGFVPFISRPDKKGYLNLKIYSPFFNLSSFLSRRPKQKASAPAKSQKAKTPYWIDRLYEKVEFNVLVQFDQLLYQNIRGSTVKGAIVLANNKLQAKNFKMNLAGGNFDFSLTLSDLQKPVNYLSASTVVRHADIRKFFYAFNNFKLTALTYENLEGKIDMNAILKARLDDDFNMLLPGLASDVEFSIKKGKLLNFKPLENMSNFLFKKRDFSNVQFDEIKSHLRIRGTEIDIRKMEVESSVLRLFVEGHYSLRNKTDMEVQVPLSNLKKRDKDYKPKNVGVNTKVGMSVFLHVYDDETGKTVISYDPFKKHVKKTAKK